MSEGSFQARAQLLLALRKGGVTDPRVLSVMEQTPRDAFVDPHFATSAWDDAALPIACGQTISQPFVVGAMTAALELTGSEKVLEIGTGSGYQTAILSKLARRVFTIERYRSMMKTAQARFEALGLNNIVAQCSDGGLGWPRQAPFDRIILTCAAPSQPDALLSQLGPGGILVAPVGAGAVQELLRYRLRPDGVFEEEPLMDVRFVPLLPGTG
ncbi:MAG: protein-L-isoaspartate(D-aspartate) O-methyltransferase [Hyphomonadaceae bacterium]|nr:protein-L-isoaspartate(D-aspartate) O-methyltransferase [Hyphomonadaceae bacterium]